MDHSESDRLSNLFELKVGNEWVYSQKNYYDVVSENSPSGTDSFLVRKRIIDIRDSPGRQYYISTDLIVRDYSWRNYEFVDNGRYFIHRYLKRSDTPQEGFQYRWIFNYAYSYTPLLKFPLRQGNYWTLERPLENDTLTIIGVDTTIGIAGQMYDHAIIVSQLSPGATMKREIVIVKGKGIVYEKFATPFGGYTRRLVTTNF